MKGFSKKCPKVSPCIVFMIEMVQGDVLYGSYLLNCAVVFLILY